MYRFYNNEIRVHLVADVHGVKCHRNNNYDEFSMILCLIKKLRVPIHLKKKITIKIIEILNVDFM